MQTTQATPETTLAELVTSLPKAAKVLHQHGLDFCCGGRTSLREACDEVGLDPADVLGEVEALVAPQEPAVRWDQRSPAELVRHIVERYHVPLEPELARLIELARKVERVHAAKPTVPRGLADHLEAVRDSIAAHLQKEEQILFPLILSGAGRAAQMPARMMMTEHDDHAANLARTRALTDGYTPPEEACATWRELYRALDELERELMEHIHLENNVLFPVVLAA